MSNSQSPAVDVDGPSASALVSDLEDAAARVEEVEDRIEEVGEDTVETISDAYDDATGLLDRYVDQATGTGTEQFRSYVEFEENFARLVESLPEDLPHRDAFETALERTDKRRLSESDFAAAHEALAPATDIASLPDERERALESYRRARREVSRRRSTVADRIDDQERLTELGDADLDAPTEDLRDPIEAYDEAVRSAFHDYRESASAREVLAFVATAAAFPLVDYRDPPDDLVDYVESHEAGTEPLPKLQEYSEYSTSKLDHYVDDAAALRRNVSTRQTYLDRLDAEPLTVDWPPEPRRELRYRCRELIAVVGRFTEGEPIERLRTVRDLTRRDDYERLRTAAVAADQLGPEDRERLRSGDVERELSELRDRKERLEAALDEYPDR